MIAAYIMTSDTSLLGAGDCLLDALKLFGAEPSSILLPVVGEGGELLGAITPGILIKEAFSGGSGASMVAESDSAMRFKKVADYMLRRLPLARPETPLAELIAELIKVKDGHGAEAVLIVDEERRFLGSITHQDIFKRLCKYSEKKI